MSQSETARLDTTGDVMTRWSPGEQSPTPEHPRSGIITQHRNRTEPRISNRKADKHTTHLLWNLPVHCRPCVRPGIRCSWSVPRGTWGCPWRSPRTVDRAAEYSPSGCRSWWAAGAGWRPEVATSAGVRWEATCAGPEVLTACEGPSCGWGPATSFLFRQHKYHLLIIVVLVVVVIVKQAYAAVTRWATCSKTFRQCNVIKWIQINLKKIKFNSVQN